MTQLYVSTVRVLTERTPSWGVPVSAYGCGKSNPHNRGLISLNIFLRETVGDALRLRIVSKLVGRTITSTKQLTVAEMYAVNRLSKDPLFLTHIKRLMEQSNGQQ